MTKKTKLFRQLVLALGLTGKTDMGPGIHVGLTIMARHPEWGMAALKELNNHVPGSDFIADELVDMVPIEIEQ